jgi:hypothetical protein
MIAWFTVCSKQNVESVEDLRSADGRSLKRLGGGAAWLVRRVARQARRVARQARRVARLAVVCGLAGVAGQCRLMQGQVITINSKTGAVTNGDTPVTVAAPVDRRFQQVTPTKVELPKGMLDEKSRLDLIRTLSSEQGFAMRPFPKGHKGLTLEANGKLEPAGEAYLNMVTNEGLSAKPGDRLVLTDLKIDHSRIEIQLNGGPDFKHRILRHIEIGGMGSMNPVVQGADEDPQGARLTLIFKGPVPDLTGKDVKALLAPLISFDVKTPIQAYTDTLPEKLKDAILNHEVWVGMSTDMLMFAKGQPDGKSREMDGQMPFEEWMYGKPPQTVEFVRVNGNRVIRVEIAKMGEQPVIFTKDVVEGLMRTDGTPLDPVKEQRVAKNGDVQRDPNTQEAAPPPSLRKPGETTPVDDPQDQNSSARAGDMRPVRFPAPKPAAQPGDNPDGEPATATPATAGAPAPDASQQNAPAKQPKQPAAPAGGPPAQQWMQSAAVGTR